MSLLIGFRDKQACICVSRLGFELAHSVCTTDLMHYLLSTCICSSDFVLGDGVSCSSCDIFGCGANNCTSGFSFNDPSGDSTIRKCLSKDMCNAWVGTPGHFANQSSAVCSSCSVFNEGTALTDTCDADSGALTCTSGILMRAGDYQPSSQGRWLLDVDSQGVLFCVPTCPAQIFYVEGSGPDAVCTHCPKVCATCANGTFCTSCPDKTYLVGDGAVCECIWKSSLCGPILLASMCLKKYS